MDASSTTMTFTHLLIIWTLLSVLLVWILLFAFLALRPERDKKEKRIEKASYSTALMSTTSSQKTNVSIAQPALSSSVNTQVYETASEVVPLV